jgi:N-formylmaleamate deformylase
VVDETALRSHRTEGDLPTIVSAHGITNSGLCWTRLSRALEDGYDMVMYDTMATGSPTPST